MPLSFRSEKWVPKRVDFKEEEARETEGLGEAPSFLSREASSDRSLRPRGQLTTLSRLRKKESLIVSNHRLLAMASFCRAVIT